MNYIAKFNPYTMEDETILAVATGRKKLLHEVLHTLEENLNGKGIAQHMLLWGPRGMGKSFFLKYLSIQFRQSAIFENCQFVLLPEEQNNILYPSDLIRMILGDAIGEDIGTLSSSWDESEESWALAYLELENYCREQKEKYGQFLLVAVVENIDELLKKFNSKIYESRLRSMLEKLENFVLIGASTRANLDGNYNKRIFKAFKPLKLRPWEGEDYTNYFDRRYLVQTQYREDYKLTEEEQTLQKNKLKAISLYTGGSPRITVVLTDLLLDKDVITTINTLYGLIDDLTPYYQDLISKIPTKSKLLFDTLIRLGENQSQSEIALQLKTTQNAISQSFRWLLDNGYVYGKKRKGSRSFFYHVNDRIFVLYYFRREIHHNKGFSTIWLLSDFLIAFYQKRELKQQAIRHLKDNPCREAIDLARLSMVASGMTRDQLPDLETAEEWLKMLEEGKVESVLPLSVQRHLKRLNEMSEAGEVDVDEILQEIEVLESEITDEFSEKAIKEMNSILVSFIIGLLKFSDNEKAIAVCNAMLKFEDRLIKRFSDLVALITNLKVRTLFAHGACLEELNKYEEAIKSYSRGTKISFSSNVLLFHAHSAYRIGVCLSELGRYEESLLNHRESAKMYKKLDDQNYYASSLDQISWCLSKLGRYEESLLSHKKSAELYKKLDNRRLYAWNLGRIGWCLSKLGRYEESLLNHRESAELFKNLNDQKRYAWNLGQIGWCLNELSRYEESIACYKESITIYKKLKTKEEYAWELGQIGAAKIMLNQYQEAWDFINQDTSDKEKVYKQLWDAVARTEQKEDRPAAFQLALKLLQSLLDHKEKLDVAKCLGFLFSDLIEMKASFILIKEIIDEAKHLFPKEEHQLILSAASHSIGYLEAGEQSDYLEKLQPDLAIAVKAIVQEAKTNYR